MISSSISSFQVPFLKFQVPVLQFQVPALKFQVHVLKFQVPVLKFQVPVLKVLVPDHVNCDQSVDCNRDDRLTSPALKKSQYYCK